MISLFTHIERVFTALRSEEFVDAEAVYGKDGEDFWKRFATTIRVERERDLMKAHLLKTKAGGARGSSP